MIWVLKRKVVSAPNTQTVISRVEKFQVVPLHPTPYPELNALLHELRASVQTILGDRWIGMYLSGSLASGDFDPERSDIDFVIVTDDDLSAGLIQALEDLHTRIAASDSKWAKRLEGPYIAQQALRRYDPAHAQHPSVRVGGGFGIDHQGIDGIIQRFILRERGVVVAGPAPSTLIDPVLPDDLRRASSGILREWWEPQLQDPFRLYVREYQAYAVLTMCRILSTLQYGTIISKPRAARWGKEALGKRWAVLIERALAWQPEDGVDDLNETLEFIRHTLERSS